MNQLPVGAARQHAARQQIVKALAAFARAAEDGHDAPPSAPDLADFDRRTHLYAHVEEWFKSWKVQGSGFSAQGTWHVP